MKPEGSLSHAPRTPPLTGVGNHPTAVMKQHSLVKGHIKSSNQMISLQLSLTETCIRRILYECTVGLNSPSSFALRVFLFSGLDSWTKISDKL
jgi:hypothetical protein